MKTLLAAISVLTLLAVAYLSVSLLVLRPPRANYSVWFGMATVIALLTASTFAAMATPRPWLRISAALAGAALAAIGIWMVRDTVTSPHFEGYALVLGSMLVAQGLVTLAAFARPTSAAI